jgi:DHA1 family multidrug resistance protein-like MFS transporter
VESWKRSFYAVLAAELLAVAGFNTSIPILPFYLQDLGVTDPTALKLWVGACSTIVAVALAVFAPIWGRLADSYGKRPMLLRAMLGGTVVLALMAVVSSPWQLFVLRGLQGALTGTVAAATVLVANITPREKVGYTLGLLQTGVYVGSSLGPAIGGIISDLFGHRITFVVTAGMLLAAALIVMRFVREEKVPRPSAGQFWAHMVPDFSPLAQSRPLLVVLLVSGIVQVATSVVSPILPLFIQSLTPKATMVATMTGLILGLSALSAALAAAGLGRVSERIGYERTLHLCLWGGLLLFVPQVFVRTPVQFLILRVLGGAFLGGTAPAINALIAVRADRNRQGTVYGLSSSINSAGAAVGPMIGASIAAAFGFASAFIATAVILLVTAVGARALTRGSRGSPSTRRSDSL